MSKQSQTPTPSPHPPVGTLIDGNTLELVEILGVGGYGVVYRAIDAFNNCPRSYAVKCLINTHGQSNSRRQLHMREFTLHQIASVHPGVVTIHRIIEEGDCTFIIMEYATDHDLFTQILQECRYLGDDGLIKHVFLQIIDAVQYCHSLGIYHRDLKPENILCFDHGYRVAITDFGLSTMDKMSEEYRTGSVYHMSPECRAANAETAVPYSPMHNDIWSLGIILLNLATGRNPWKAATPDDPTYQAYQRDPLSFLPGVLPISEELNDILVQTLDIDWKGRLSLSELREAVKNLTTCYSPTVIFEGSLARCPWESGMDLGNGAGHKPVNKRPVPRIPRDVEPYRVVSTASPVNPIKEQIPKVQDRSGRLWKADFDPQDVMDICEENASSSPYESSGCSSFSSDPSLPATPSSFEARSAVDFARIRLEDEIQKYDCHSYAGFGMNSVEFPSYAENDDEGRYASSVFLATPIAEEKPNFPESKPTFVYPPEPDSRKRYTTTQPSAFPNLFIEKDYERPNHHQYRPKLIKVDHVIPPSPAVPDFDDSYAPRSVSRPIDIRGLRKPRERTKSPNLLNSLLFFPGPSWLNPARKSPPSTRQVFGSSTGRTHVVDSYERSRIYRDDRHQKVPPTHGRPIGGSRVQARQAHRGVKTDLQPRPGREWFSGRFFGPESNT